jgi:putative ABC transport system permease protein
MLQPRWRKVFQDLGSNKTRTILVVLSIAVGVFAVGMIATSRLTLSQGLASDYAAINPSSAMLMVSNPLLGGGVHGFDDELVQAVRRIEGVQEAEGRRMTVVRLQVGPEQWRDLQLIAIPDYEQMRINKVRPETGAWPPLAHEILIERAALGLTQAAVGDHITIKTPSGKERVLHLVGLAHDLSRLPSFLDGTIYGYISFDTLEWLGEPRTYNELHIVAAGDRMNKAHVQAVANAVKDKVERSGRPVMFTQVPEPGKHPLDTTIQTLVLLLGVLGVLALGLSGFLVMTTISALLAQHTRQIGILKSIGARNDQIMAMYFSLVLIFGLLALLLALPLGAIGAQLFTSFMAGLFNFNLNSFEVPPQVLALEVVVSLLVPVLAALYPILRGVGITVREALQDYGVGSGGARPGARTSWLGRLNFSLAWLPLLGSRPVLLALRNAFRQKGRLALTLLTLTMSGAIFISVFSVRDSLLQTLNELLSSWRYDVWVTFSQPYRNGQIESAASQVPGVTQTASVGFTTARRIRADESESEAMVLLAPPGGSDLMMPPLVEGRWLLPEDERAVVLSTAFLLNEPDVGVGSEVVLSIEGQETAWRVVGIAQFIAPFGYVNYEPFVRVTGEVGRATTLWVVTEQHDGETQTAVARALERHYEELGLRVSSVVKIAEERAEVEASFNIVVTLLALMAVLLAVVGGLGLMGTMSINVLERTREFGVMRSIGASTSAVLRIVMVEGVIIGMLSWLLGALLALPLSKALSYAVGEALLQSPLAFIFSTSGMLMWLGVVVVLAAFASFLPAWNASRLTIRDVLAYQ